MAFLRDREGKFVPGTQGGPGRPPRKVESEYLRTLAEVCPPEVWKQICQKAVQNALAGEARARDWLSRYLLGETTVGQLAAPQTQAKAFAQLCEALGVTPSDNGLDADLGG